MNFNQNNQMIINNLIQCEVDRISQKYNKDFLDCEDLIKITGLGRDNVRNLMRSENFPTTKVGKRQVVSGGEKWLIKNIINQKQGEQIMKALYIKEVMDCGLVWQLLDMTKMASKKEKLFMESQDLKLQTN